MKFAGTLPAALAAIASLAMLAGCSQTDSLGHGLGVKSAVAKVMPASAYSTRGKRYRASERERQCLARAMFFESNRSSRDGLVAVGSVVMNRRDSGRWGGDICSVVGAKRQFAPGVMSRPMNSKALPDVMAAADAVLAGERHRKVHKDVMFFHTAGLKFPYKNMHYTVVAGGNSFYEKRSRRPMRLDPPAENEVMIASAEPLPAEPANSRLPGVADGGSIVQAPVQTARLSAPKSRTASTFGSDRTGSVVVAAASSPRKPQPITPVSRPAEDNIVVAAAQLPVPKQDRLGDQFPPAPPLPSAVRFGSAPTTLQAQAEEIEEGGAEPTLSFEASEDQATEVGELLLMQQGQ